MPASLGIQSVMITCAFLPNGGMTTEPGPDEVAIGVAGAVEAGPPGLNAGGGGELHAVRPEQNRAVQTTAVRISRARVAVETRAARVAVETRAARVAVETRAARVAAGNGRRRVMRLTSARTGGARR